ncbi:MAG: amino acid adenylation domain-containing protein [Gammaproteobacteria bacterium]
MLKTVLNDVTHRHPVLRTRIPAVAGRPVAIVDPPTPTGLVIEDIDGGKLAGRLYELARIPLDTGHGPLFHARLLRVGPDDHHLLLVASHIVTDATSNHLLFEDIATALAGRPLAPLSLSVPYAEFARRQREAAKQGVWQVSLDWWVECLAGAPPALELPTDYPRPAEQHYAGGTVRRSLPAALVASLYRLASERQCTPYMVLLAAFKALLHRYSGATDVLVGTPIEGRDSTDVEAVIGLFINTLVMRTDLSGDPSFDSLLARVRHSTVEAQAHQDLPFEKLVEALAPERSLSRSPVFQVLFNLIQLPERVRHAGGLTLRMDRLIDQGVSGFDLSLTAAVESEGVTLNFEYATELFHESTIGYLADAYLVLLQAALADPSLTLSRFPLLGDVARNAVLALGQGTSPDTGTYGQPFKAVHEQVAEVARCRPDSIAVSLAMPGSGDGQSLSYGELDARANRLARHLQTLIAGMPANCGGPVRIGICMSRTPDCLVAVLAVLKAGGAYVPLDPDWPDERLASLAADAMLSGVIVDGTTSHLLSSTGWCVDIVRDQHLVGAQAATAPAQTTAPDSAAYLVHTSGSTGKPKAVIVTHANLAAAMAAWKSAWDLQADEAHLQMAGIAFDVFSGDWVRALGSGGKLVLCPRETLLDPPALLAVLQHADIRIAEFVPAIMRALVVHCRATDSSLPALRLFIVGSDTWHTSDLAALRAVAAPQTRLINSYGVAEATIDSCWFDATSSDIRGSVPIGRPFPGAALYVVDEHGELLPPGVPGELCIGGSGVAAGYWNADPADVERFTAGGRYRTGDIARWNPAGQLELIGRRDSQIKLRGFRIEPAEVEACLARCPGVNAAVVALQPATPGHAGAEPRLIAWIATGEPPDGGPGDGQHGLDAEELRLALARQLPAQMVPVQFILRPTLPLTTSGKVDRQALAAYPVPSMADATGRGLVSSAEAANPVEAVIVEAVAGLLDRSTIGVDDDFFRAGGHSLLAAQLVARLRVTLQVELPLRAIFEAPTPRGLAAIVVSLRRGREWAAQVFRPPVRHQRTGADTAPLSAMQMRLWFLERLNPGSATYHLHWLVHLEGALDCDALQSAVDVLIARHEVLRTSFIHSAGVPVQSIAAEARVVVEVVDTQTAAERQAIIRARIDQPFDLATSPLFRVVLLPGVAGEHQILLVIHHLVADGWSFGVLSRELAAAYNAARRKCMVSLPDLPLQYADYALWQQSTDYQARLERQLAWWRPVLAGAPAVLELTSAAGRAAYTDVDTDSRGAWLERVVPAADARELRRLASAEGVTLFMVLLAVFKAVLGRLAHTNDVVVGTPVAGRSHRNLEDLIGFFVNTLVLRTSLTRDLSFRDLLVRVRHTTLEAFDHAEVPFEKLVEVLQPPRTLAHSPVVQVLFALHNQPRQPLILDGLVATAEAVPAGSVKFDLNLHVAEEGENLRLALAWRSSLYTEEAAAMLLDACVALMTRAVAAPDRPLGELLDESSLKNAAAAVRRSDDRCDPPVVGPAQWDADVSTDVSADVPDAALAASLQDIWSILLGRPDPGLDDDFFALGGHSLLAMRLVAAIAERFAVELPLISVFEAPTMRLMAVRIVEARRSAATLSTGEPAVGSPIRRLPRLADEGFFE